MTGGWRPLGDAPVASECLLPWSAQGRCCVASRWAFGPPLPRHRGSRQWLATGVVHRGSSAPWGRPDSSAVRPSLTATGAGTDLRPVSAAAGREGLGVGADGIARRVGRSRSRASRRKAADCPRRPQDALNGRRRRRLRCRPSLVARSSGVASRFEQAGEAPGAWGSHAHAWAEPRRRSR